MKRLPTLVVLAFALVGSAFIGIPQLRRGEQSLEAAGSGDSGGPLPMPEPLTAADLPAGDQQVLEADVKAPLTPDLLLRSPVTFPVSHNGDQKGFATAGRGSRVGLVADDGATVR